MSTRPELAEIVEEIVNVANTLSLVTPIIGIAANLINNIFITFENIKHNKKNSRTIIDHIVFTEAAIKSLKFQKNEYNEKFPNLQYQELFFKFQSSLEKLKYLQKR
ncbi:hypothetical protein F8M41_022887 [Gigaspora margarita]|uniref:Uncharacterized protein n=1 Tax=Gigaspora margarita TaxID=4874 RepID=A0A8H4AEC3_GIGMA|nr:hypothetical protein F8M41_022887 [Gigaspora margarita]